MANDHVFEYWREGVATALEEVGIEATSEQLDQLAETIQVYSDNRSLAFGPVESHYPQEIARLKQKIREEEEKNVPKPCPTCQGRRGSHYFLNDQNRSVWRVCPTCHGNGLVYSK